MLAFANIQTRPGNRKIVDPATELSRCARDVPRHVLNTAERAFAATAWGYFERFTIQNSGLVGGTEHKTILSVWELGGVMLATIAASRLDLIGQQAAQKRLSRILTSIGRLQCGRGHLPFAAIDAANPAQTPTADIVETVDLMRLVSAFIVTAHHYPPLAAKISTLLNGWDVAGLFANARARARRRSQVRALSTGLERNCLGYEQYAARVAHLVDLPTDACIDPKPVLTAVNHKGLILPCDTRSSRGHTAVVTSDPFCLEALEFGWREDMLGIAVSLFQAQRGRFTRFGILTALAADALDQEPGFAAYTVLADKKPFVVLDQDGRDISQFACISTKAAFCWNVLLPSPYSTKILDAISDLARPCGWLAGRYERSGKPNDILTLNTNAEILEALHYRVYGPLFPAAQ